MPRKKPPLGKILVAATAVLLAYYLSIPLLGAHYAEACRHGFGGAPNDCSSWDVVTASILRAYIWADEQAGFVAAISSVAVAVFTAVLWVATDRLWHSANDQGVAMDRSIAEAARAASAMEGVSASMAINAEKIIETVDINKEIAARQKVLGEAQLRAYVSVLIGGALYQDAVFRFEARPLLFNSGGTPARKVRWRMAAAILPIPLPDDFRFPLPERPKKAGGGLLIPPQQSFETRAWVDGRVDDADVVAIKLSSGKALYVWGVVAYEDIFRRRRRTTFAQQIFWQPAGPVGPDGQQPETIRGNYLPKHSKAN